VEQLGLDRADYGTHSLRRTKAAANSAMTPAQSRLLRRSNHFNGVFYAAEGEIDSGHPGPRPAGALRASKIAPGDFVELTSPVKGLRFSMRTTRLIARSRHA
jgi:hypothetical protein